MPRRLDSPRPYGRFLVSCSFNLDGDSYHGDQEKSEKSSEKTGQKKEEESSIKKESRKEEGCKEEGCQEEGSQETREEKESSQKGCPETGQKEKGEARCKTGGTCNGSGGSGPVHSSDAWRKDCAESGSRLAVSDGLKALSGNRTNCGQPVLTHGLIRRRSVVNGTPGLATEGLRILSGHRTGKPGFSRIDARILIASQQ